MKPHPFCNLYFKKNGLSFALVLPFNFDNDEFSAIELNMRLSFNHHQLKNTEIKPEDLIFVGTTAKSVMKYQKDSSYKRVFKEHTIEYGKMPLEEIFNFSLTAFFENKKEPIILFSDDLEDTNIDKIMPNVALMAFQKNSQYINSHLQNNCKANLSSEMKERLTQRGIISFPDAWLQVQNINNYYLLQETLEKNSVNKKKIKI